MSVEISTSTVVRAAYELHTRFGHWPSSGDLAEYLQAKEGTVRARLLELRRARLFRDRQRDGRRVWMPWGAV